MRVTVAGIVKEISWFGRFWLSKIEIEIGVGIGIGIEVQKYLWSSRNVSMMLVVNYCVFKQPCYKCAVRKWGNRGVI
jgi:hypothetical protein